MQGLGCKVQGARCKVQGVGQGSRAEKERKGGCLLPRAPPPRQSVEGGNFSQKRTLLTFENNCLEGKITLGDPFEDYDVARRLTTTDQIRGHVRFE